MQHWRGPPACPPHSPQVALQQVWPLGCSRGVQVREFAGLRVSFGPQPLLLSAPLNACRVSFAPPHDSPPERALVLSECATDEIVQCQPPTFPEVVATGWGRRKLDARARVAKKVLRHPATRPPRAAGRRQQHRDRIAQAAASSVRMCLSSLMSFRPRRGGGM